MSILTLLPPGDPRWRTFVVSHATSPMQHPMWLDAITHAYHLEARIMALTDSHGAILAGLPMIRSKLPWRNRWTSLPFTDTLKPVAVGDAYRDELLIAAADDADIPPIIIRTQTNHPGWFCRQVGTVQVVDLSNGAEGVLRGAKSKTRQNIRLAQKSGLITKRITSREEFLGPNLALVAMSRRRLGAPTQPRRYWSRVWEMHERDEALTIGVYLGDELVANAVFIIGSTHAVFKYSASDVATRDLRTNYLALAAGLQHLATSGVQSMDFGITDLRNMSLREYKARWGGEEQPAHFSATDTKLLPNTLEPGRLLTEAIQRAPVFVGRTVGSLAYPLVA